MFHAQQNGSVERKHWHIVEVGLSLLAHASMPLKFWDEAFITAVFLINRLPSKVIDHQMPCECLLNSSLITCFSALLGVPVGQTFGLTITESFNSVPVGVFFLAIVIFTKGLKV